MNHKDDTLYATTLLGAFAGLALAALGTAAQAQAPSVNAWIDEVKSVKTRAEVLAELAQARADGSTRATAADYDFVAATRALKSREQVRRELREARADGEYAAMNAEAYGFAPARLQVVAQH